MFMHLRHSLTCAILLGGLGACTQFPELDAVQTPGVATAAYPDLLPIEDLLNGPVPEADAAAIASVQGRVSALRARAARLQRVQGDPGDVDGRMARLRRKAADLRSY